MLTLEQLQSSKDTVGKEVQETVEKLSNNFASHLAFKTLERDSLPYYSYHNHTETKDYFTDFEKADVTTKKSTLATALTKARNIRNLASGTGKILEHKRNDIIQHDIEINRKFTLSIACLVLFLVGAPFGSIIRKGGFWLAAGSFSYFVCCLSCKFHYRRKNGRRSCSYTCGGHVAFYHHFTTVRDIFDY